MKKAAIKIKITVCRSTEEIPDFPALCLLIQQQLESTGVSIPHLPDIASSAVNALSKGSGSIFFLAYSPDGKLRGFAFGNMGRGLETGGNYLWLNELFVAPKYRRMGIASSLLDHIEQWAVKEGCKSIALVTGMNNRAAASLYRNSGFSVSEIAWASKKLK